MSLSVLANMLTRAAGRPVMDGTGLTGWYKVRLHWNAQPPPVGGKVGLGTDPGFFRRFRKSA